MLTLSEPFAPGAAQWISEPFAPGGSMNYRKPECFVYRDVYKQKTMVQIPVGRSMLRPYNTLTSLFHIRIT
jgi:hypothetical protein